MNFRVVSEDGFLVKIVADFSTLEEFIIFKKNEYIRNKGYTPKYLILSGKNLTRLKIETSEKYGHSEPKQFFYGMKIIIGFSFLDINEVEFGEDPR